MTVTPSSLFRTWSSRRMYVSSQCLVYERSLLTVSQADIWTLPGKQRLHAAIGKAGQPTPPALDGREVRNALGIIMSMHLTAAPHPHAAGRTRLRLLCAYENGSVAMREYARDDKEVSIEGVGWAVLWSVKHHVESGRLFQATNHRRRCH